MKKRLLTTLLAMWMLCALVGCKATKPDDNDKTTTTTTTVTKQETAPLTLVEQADAAGNPMYVDTAVDHYNYSLVLTANTDLTDVCFLALNPDPPTVGDTLYTLPSLDTGAEWTVRTYVNDTIPNRGISCTDKDGKTYYYAITYSGKDGSIRLKELNITPLSEERLTEIETFLNNIENNGFVCMNEYTGPEEASLFGILYDGAGIGVGSWEWTDEEAQDYIVAAEWEEFYVSALRFARTDVEALLQKKLGISIADLSKDIDMLYIEKYDAYYHAHSDTQYQSIEVESGWLEGGEGGLFIVNYNIGHMGDTGRVTLRLTKDGYQFVSNRYTAQ